MATGKQKEVDWNLGKVETLTLQTVKYTCYSSIVVCQDKLVVIDSNVNKVQLFQLHDGQFLATIDRLVSVPCDLCLMDAMTICVLHVDGVMQIMSMDCTDMSRVLKTTRELRLQGVMDYYRGVVRFKDNLVVCGDKQGIIYWCVVSLHDGHVDTIHQICKWDRSWWCSVTTKDNIVYVACVASVDNTGVYGFDILNPSKCKYKYKHPRLQDPTSIVINEDGNIFVCNERHDDSCIHQLTASCQLVAIFTLGIPRRPFAMLWDNGRLYVTCYGSRYITVLTYLYQGNHEDSEVGTSIEIEQGNVDKVLSSVKTEMPPSVPDPENSEDEKQEVLMIEEKEKPVIEEASTKTVQEIPIQQIDEESLEQAGSQKDIEDSDLFIVFQREIGIPLHFSKDPQALINAQRSLNDTEMFLQKNRPDMMEKWLEYKNQGKLVRELIDVIYAQERYPKVHDKIGNFLEQMEQSNIIFKARSFDENGIKEENYFLTPCMLDKESPREVISPMQDPRMVRTPVLLFVLTGQVMQPCIFNELLAAFGRQWPVAKRMETSEILMFCNCAVYDLGVFHRLILHYRNHVICARVTRMLSVEGETPDARLCTRVRRFLTLNLRNIISRQGHNLKYELCVQCEESEDVSEDNVFLPPCHMWFLPEDPDLPIKREHMNHARLNVVLVTVCGKAMRDVLVANFETQYNDIYQAILAKRYRLTPARGRSVLNQHQIQLVYPDHPNGQQTGTLDQFDLSLLYTLIRNVSTVPEPTTFWGNEPQDTPRDSSIGASVERIRLYRNLISGHSPDATMEEEEFENYWFKFDAVLRDIENALGRQVYCSELARHRRHVISVYEA